jgi:K+-transporting ATPase KdpF subunit
VPTGPSEARPGVSATNLIGLILAVVLTVFLVIALIFPEKF